MTSPLRVLHGDGLNGDPLPHNIAAEQAVLGAAMLSPAALAEARAVLDGSEFHRPAHGVIWQAITTLADHGDPHDPLTVGAALGKNLAIAGGAPYLHTLIAAVPTAANGGYYAHIVRDLAYARHVIDTGTRLIQLGSGGTDPADLRAMVTAETAALAAAELRGWPDPIPLSAAPQVPEFPLWALPPWLGEYAASVAETTQTPADLAGSLALAVLSVAASGKVWIQAPAWQEPACLYVVVVLPPGTRKSEVFRAMTAPVRAAEKTLIDTARPHIAEALIRRKIAEAAADKTARTAETAASSPDPGKKTAALIDAAEARLELDNATIPAEPCLFADDTTIEELGTLLAEHGGRFAVLSPEGEIFAIAAGRYSGAPNLGTLKSAHAGEPIRVNRRSRAEHIDAATLTLGICTQPGVLTRLGDTPQLREQGLLARLLYAVPESRLGYRNPSPDPMPPAARDHYTATLTALTLSLHDYTEPHTLTFDPAAANGVTSLLAAIEPRFRPGTGDLAHMTDWGGKLAGATVRIAGLLHLAAHVRDGWDRPITTTTLEAATELGAYYTAHAKAAYDTIGADPATNHARAILQWLHTTHPAQVTNRDLMRGIRDRFTKATDLTAPLAILESRGWIRQRPQPRPGPSGGRPTAPTWDIHPTITSQP